MTASVNRACEFCGTALARSRKESPALFAERKFCNWDCRFRWSEAKRMGPELEARNWQLLQTARQAPFTPSDDHGDPTATERGSAAPPGPSVTQWRPERNLGTTFQAAKPLLRADWRRGVYGDRSSGVERKRRSPRKVDRERVLARQGDVCLYCQIPIGTLIERERPMERRRSRRKLQICLKRAWDHFVPYSHALDNAGDNWVLACHVCNAIKGAKTFATIDDVRRLILPRRVEIGYEDARAVLLRLELDAATTQAGQLPQLIAVEGGDDDA